MEVLQSWHCATMRNTPVRKTKKMMDLPDNEQEDQALLHNLANQTLKDRGHTKTSPLWNFFHIDQKFICRATCNICGKSISRGQRAWQLSTSTLRRHLQTKHSTHWTLACQVDGVVVGETTNQLIATDCLELCSSKITSTVSGPSVLMRVEDSCVTDQDQLLLCASEPPEMPNNPLSPPEPSHSFLPCWEEDPQTSHVLSTLKKKCKKKPCKLNKIQPNEIAFQDVQPLTTFGFGPSELERCAPGQGSSLKPVLTLHKLIKRSKSLVWKFFLVDSESPSKATCAVCSRNVSRGCPGTPLGTSALQRHLVAKHPVHWSMASKSRDESEMLDYTLRFSLPPMSAGVKNAYSGVAMMPEATTETSIPQYLEKLQEEQRFSTNENVMHELNLLTCHGRYACSVGQLHVECKNLPGHLNEESVLFRKQNHNTGKNCKIEPALLSRCTDKKVYDDKLCRVCEKWKNDTPKPVTVLLDGAHNSMLLEKNTLKVEPGCWSTSAQSEVQHPVQNVIVNKDGQQDETQKAKHPSLLQKILILSDSKSGTFKQSVGGIPGVLQAGYYYPPRKEEGIKIRPEVEQLTRQKNAYLRVTTEDKRPFPAKNLCRVLESYYPANHDATPQVGNDKDNANSCKRKKWLKSPVWNLFNTDPNIHSHAICIICKRSISRGRPGTPLGTTALQRHLVAKHAVHWNVVIENSQCNNALSKP